MIEVAGNEINQLLALSFKEEENSLSLIALSVTQLRLKVYKSLES